MAEALKREAQIEVLARDLAKAHVLYLGRGTWVYRLWRSKAR